MERPRNMRSQGVRAIRKFPFGTSADGFPREEADFEALKGGKAAEIGVFGVVSAKSPPSPSVAWMTLSSQPWVR